MAKKSHAVSKELALRPYTRDRRKVEVYSVYSAAVLHVIVLVQVLRHFQPALAVDFVLGYFLGMLAIDFFTAFLHWGFDNWGSVDFPVLGKSFIRPFREHHMDPLEITRHDFTEINGYTCTVALVPLLLIAFPLCALSPEQIRNWYTIFCFLMGFAQLGTVGNQIHMWSHMHHGVPRWVGWLQKLRLILPRDHHHIHHVSPHETYYGITSGWVDYPLDVLNFWSTLEYVIERLTGRKPRTDDLKWAE